MVEANTIDEFEKPAPRKPERVLPTAETVRAVFGDGTYRYDKKMSRRSYENQKAKLQAELLKVQLWAQETGQKFVLLFEGRDAAGKGGTIKRFTEHLNPRAARVVALNKPTSRKRDSGISSAMLSTCRRAGKSSSMTGPGIIEPALSGSWVSVNLKNTLNLCAKRPCLSKCWCAPAFSFTNTGSQ